MTREELDALGHSLAYEMATTDIECDSRLAIEDGVEWYDLEGRTEEEWGSLRYLRARGVVVGHPDKPGWITFLDESEGILR